MSLIWLDMPKRPVHSDLATTSEITLKEHVLPVGDIQQTIRTAHAAGLKKIPLPRSILDYIRLTPVQTVEEVLEHALLG